MTPEDEAAEWARAVCDDPDSDDDLDDTPTLNELMMDEARGQR